MEIISPVVSTMLTQAPNTGTDSSNPSDYVSPGLRHLHSRTHSASHILCQNDDAKEKRERQNARMVEMQRINLNSPSTPSDRRRSLITGDSGMSNIQIATHYANCIKLNSENKITVKNAFNLHLIDYMSEMLKNQGDVTNFQQASCTLDASAKIYACRVDAMYTEVYKVAGGLGRSDKRKFHESGDAVEKDSQGEGKGEIPENPKRNKTVRKKNTVLKNVNTLNVNKYDLEFEVDPLFRKTSAAFDEGGVDRLLVNLLSCYDDNHELILDSSTMAEKMDYIQNEQTCCLDLKLFQGVAEDLHICPEFYDFEFSSWEKSKDSSLHEHCNEHMFDINAPVEPVQSESLHLPDNISMSHSEHVSDNEMILENEVNTQDESEKRCASKPAESSRAHIALADVSNMNSLATMLSTEPSEYSYFSKEIISAWAGPEHWKLRPISKDTCKHGLVTSRKKGAKKPPFRIDHCEDINFNLFFKKTRAATMLALTTIKKYQKSSVCLPKDLHFDNSKLFQLFKKSVTVKWKDSQAYTTNCEIGNYNFHNPNDVHNFCPNEGGQENEEEEDRGFEHVDDTTTCLEETGFTSQLSPSQPPSLEEIPEEQEDALFGDNLVAEPRKVNKIDIAYAKSAKRIDVKKLKAVMWMLLSQSCNKENYNIEQTLTVFEKSMILDEKSFKHLYSLLPGKLSQRMVENLTMPIAFVCLLHIANEKNLQLVAQDDLQDFLIAMNS